MYKELLQKDIDVIERGKIDESNKTGGIRKYNILNILKNIGSIFTGAYFHYKNVYEQCLKEVSQKEQN